MHQHGRVSYRVAETELKQVIAHFNPINRFNPNEQKTAEGIENHKIYIEKYIGQLIRQSANQRKYPIKELNKNNWGNI